MNLNEKKKKVEDILLMPIVSSKSVKGITLAIRQDNKKKFILSGQTYENGTDEDMSDIAIAFYQKIYSQKKENNSCEISKILTVDGKIINPQIAGDTMNSFKQITSRVSCTDTKKDEWFNFYHCLANFWILPMEIGRQYKRGFSKSQVSKDYMDGFLIVLKAKYEDYKKEYPDFFDRMKTFKDFCESQYITPYFKDNNIEEKNIIEITGLKNADDSIEKMKSLVESRARLLADECSDSLYDFFQECGIVERDQ